MATLKTFLVIGFTLCSIVFLVSDLADAVNHKKRGRKKAMRKGRNNMKKSIFVTPGNSNKILNDTGIALDLISLKEFSTADSKPKASSAKKKSKKSKPSARNKVLKSPSSARVKTSKSSSSARKKSTVSGARQKPTNSISNEINISSVSSVTPTHKKLKEIISSARTKTKKAPKPHIIFVVADDLGYNDVGYHTKGTGCIAHTPNINDLALNGIRLENYYTQSTCTPSRASIMTGKYPIRLGLQHGNLECNVPRCLPLEEVTLPERLKGLGYATHAVGKWHLGFASPRCLPTRRGFDSHLGILPGAADHLSYIAKTRLKAKCLFDNETLAIGEEYWKHSSDLYTERAIDIIRNHDESEPLFLYLSYQAVHTPLINTPGKYSFYEDNYPTLYRNATKSIEQRMAYLSLLETLDQGLGEVTKELKRAGLWDNSVLVFTSDNGGRRGGASNWPLRGQKNSYWEGGIKGVAFINSPLLPPSVIGSVHNGLMHVSDWLPTLVEGVAGGTIEGKLSLDGFNMWLSLTQNQASPRAEILHNIKRFKQENLGDNRFQKKRLTPTVHDAWASYTPFNPLIPAAIRDERWKLITGYQEKADSSWLPPEETFKSAIPMTSVRDEEGIYIRLYDMSKDPEEKHNVALYHRHIVYRLLHRLAHYNDNILALPSFVTQSKKKGMPQPIPELPGVLAWVPWLP